MKRDSRLRVLVPLFVISLMGSRALAQARSGNPAAGEPALRGRGQVVVEPVRLELAVAAGQVEAQVQEQLQQIIQQVQRTQQMPTEDRVNSLRELERALVKLQETEQRRRMTIAPNGANQAVVLQSAAQALQQATQEVQGGRGQRSGGGQRGGAAPGTVGGLVAPANGGRLVVRQNALGGGLNVQVGGGAWWTDANLTSTLGLTEDQKARIDRAFTNHRTNLEGNRNNLEREEAQLARLLDAEPLDRNAITSQVARVTSARGEVERENAAMTLEMREQMSRAQWNQLQVISPRATVMVDVPVTPLGTAAPGGFGRGTGAPAQTPFGTVTPGTRGGRGARGQQQPQ